jgi:putative glutamine amidotransferase
MIARSMPTSREKPLIGIPAKFVQPNEMSSGNHSASHKYALSAIELCGAIPLVIPALPDPGFVKDVLTAIDGLLLTGGGANIEPHHYGGPPFPPDEKIDPERDNTVLPLIRGCVDHTIPVFGVCRGHQEINVALGGSLHYRIHELPGKNDHRMNRDVPTREERFALRHKVHLVEGSLFHRLLGQTEVMTNSLHAQGVDRAAPGLSVDAVSEDGVVEGIVLRDSGTFTVGVQWHAEFHPDYHELSDKLFREFGKAAYLHLDRAR